MSEMTVSVALPDFDENGEYDDEYPDIDDDIPMRAVVNVPVSGDLL